jgi:hypothetical protein
MTRGMIQLQVLLVHPLPPFTQAMDSVRPDNVLDRVLLAPQPTFDRIVSILASCLSWLIRSLRSPTTGPVRAGLMISSPWSVGTDGSCDRSA